MWEEILTAPFLRRLELAVLDEEGMHPLVFPCERTLKGWKHAITGMIVDVDPTHWRDWIEPEQTAG
ncbi:hypothetical protein P9272_35475 [Mesorhizobium sp. WSM4976]|nr:hypothetical protein [Mesorhizobium sp. WSM4976]MDG4898789.1 hypothetical protein [Mesorhizobium sp. WSM4976]